MKKNSIRQDLYSEIEKLGAKDMEICMQCGNCSAACPLSSGTNTFPRRVYRFLQLGLEHKLLESPEPWLCYYCGDCNTDCPRGAEPAETMMATRRWLTTQYDWTGLARRFYASPAWEVGAFGLVALSIITLFVFFHGPIVTDRVALNTFAPVAWIKLGDKIMLTVLGALLLSNGFRMYSHIMRDTKIPLLTYITEAKTFILHYFTQKRWRKCGTEQRGRWWRHFLLFSGYVTMEVLVIGFLGSFQTEIVHPMWHPTRIFGYYATVAIMLISADMLISRYKKEEKLHRYSDFTDWFFLVLLFLMAFTGIFLHFFRLAGWPYATYFMYVIHLAICVGMLCIMIPFGKLGHLFYRPLAIFLTTVKERATKDSKIDIEAVKAVIGETFMSCLQCGTCTAMCPWNQVSSYNPRQILRYLCLDTCTEQSVDTAVWSCVTCNQCGQYCPQGIDIIDLIKEVRVQNIDSGRVLKQFEAPLGSLKDNGNPWSALRDKRLEWTENIEIPAFTPANEYCLFTCCTTAYDTSPTQGSQKAGQALPRLLNIAEISFGTLGTKESCCGDQAHKIGATDIFSDLVRQNTDLFLGAGVQKILTTSPHCLNAFKKNYNELQGSVGSEHYSELLDRLVANGGLKPVLEVNRIVTYHDPCYLGRHNGIYDAPRRVLQSIPGLTLVEMPSNKASSLCCGGGGGGAWRDTPRDQRFDVLRIREALNTGADVIATACPYCIRMLNDAVSQLGVADQIVVRDLAELLLQSVEIPDKSDKEDKNKSFNRSVEQEECHV